MKIPHLSPTASLAWNRGVHNGMIYLTGNLPVGSNDSQRLANIGIGFWAVDAGGGYMYFNQQTGREFSAVVGCTYNFENTSTDYQNGIDSHLDFDLRIWTDQYADWSKIRSEVAVAVHDAVQAAGMSFPFPQREVLLRHDKKA